MSQAIVNGSTHDETLAFLSGGGEMARLIGSMDWSATSLGPIQGWSPVLRTTVSICLGSNVPMSIIWGAGRAQVYNDGYRALCGSQHPLSMGQDYKDCWASAWDVFREPFARALEGNAGWVENRRMFVDRSGSPEETLLSFSLSPIRDEMGRVVGLAHLAIDITRSALSERRERALVALASRAHESRSLAEVLSVTAQTLAAHVYDVPFILLYAVEDGSGEARLVAAAGLDESSPVRPSSVSSRSDGPVWPIARALGSPSVIVVNDIATRLESGAAGPYGEPPNTALVKAITPCGAARPQVLMIAGVSSRRPLDDAYAHFFERVAECIAHGIARARARASGDGSATLDDGAARRRAEAALRQAHDDLEASSALLRAEVLQRERSEAARNELLRQVATAQEDERRRIARDLHDSIGQLVTGLSLAFKAVATAGDLSARSAARLAEAQRITDTLGREVHHLAVQLRPVSLDELGLEAAVQDLVNAWSTRTGVRTECAISLGRTRLTREIETTLYRVVQEGLTNVAKHARASVVSVVFTRVDGYVSAVVEDDGVGFEPEAASTGRLGLLGMRERASQVAGDLDIESKPGWGTTVLVRIPLPPEPSGYTAGQG